MFQFNRGITWEFVDRLNAEYECGGWWKAIADDRQLFIAIREDYVSVYWKGSSLLKLWLEGNDLIGETHYKYLLRPNVKQPYVRIAGGRAKHDVAPADLLMADIADLDGLKRSANVYVEEEKKGVHQIVLSNSNVIDVEIAFSAEKEEREVLASNRIDFAALRLEQHGPEIVFYEAKLFCNKELRAEGGDVPVLNQLRRYGTFLHSRKSELIRSYRRVCGNLLSLKGVCDRYSEIREIMKGVANEGPLGISDNVRLVIFGYDSDQDNGAVWGGHRQKLKGALRENLLHRGDAKGFTKGISSRAR